MPPRWDTNAVALVLVNGVTALYMTGVIWTIQVAHYKLFDKVGESGWLAYHSAHTEAMGVVVMLPMLAELVAAIFLALNGLPGVPRWLLAANLACVLGAWGVTFFVSVPLHSKLSTNYDLPAIHALVATNWFRTLFWTGHGAVAVELLRRALLR